MIRLICRVACLATLLGSYLPVAGAATPKTSADFDHLTTGFDLIGKHRDLPCESCHVNAIFKGTPKDCASCHGVAPRFVRRRNQRTTSCRRTAAAPATRPSRSRQQ